MNSIIVNGNGHTHTVHSGTDAKGKPYYIEIDEEIKDGVLRHTERTYNETTKKYQTHVIERRISDAGDEPHIIFNNFTESGQKL